MGQPFVEGVGVDGPRMLRGPEKDEVEGEDEETDDEDDNEDEDGDMDQDEDASAAGKKRKRAKVDATKKDTAANSGAQVQSARMPQSHSFSIVSTLGASSSAPAALEKRRRGPCKNALPSPVPMDAAGGVQDVFSMQHTITLVNIKMEVDTQAQAQQPQIVTSQLTISYSWGRNVNYNGTKWSRGSTLRITSMDKGLRARVRGKQMYSEKRVSH